MKQLLRSTKIVITKIIYPKNRILSQLKYLNLLLNQFCYFIFCFGGR